MPFEFSFRSVQTTKEIKKAVEFLAGQDLKYPRYAEWVQKAEEELLSGYKRAALAYSEGFLVGDIVWQAHKRLSRVREIKNLRISPRVARRHIGSFLARQVEYEDRETFDAIIVDARENQRDVIEMMKSLGYRVVEKLNLYDDERKEVVLFKDFTRAAQSNLWTRKN